MIDFSSSQAELLAYRSMENTKVLNSKAPECAAAEPRFMVTVCQTGVLERLARWRFWGRFWGRLVQKKLIKCLI